MTKKSVKNKFISSVIACGLLVASLPIGMNMKAFADAPVNGTPYNLSGAYDVTVPHVIINQIYGGYNPSKDVITNNSDGTFTITKKDKGQASSNSFVELYNPTDSEVNLNGWSLQYSASNYYNSNEPTVVQNGGWAVLSLTGKIEPHSSYLVRCAATGSTAVTSTFGLNLKNVAADQDWNMPLNTKGISVALLDTTDPLASNSNPFNNRTHTPNEQGYVDMLSVNGNDSTPDEMAQAYEGSTTNSQSKQKAIRRINFTDTDNNAAGDDASENQKYDTQVIGYNTSDLGLLNWARPRTSADGPWSASKMPNPSETTTLSSTSINSLTNSFGTDPKTTRTFTWEMPAAITSGQVEISTDSSFPAANTKSYSATVTSSDEGKANTFRVSISGLTPGTTYYYRAENGSVYSKVYSIKTEASAVSSFSFVQLSDTEGDEDVQTSATDTGLNYGTWGTAITAITQQYKPDFIMELGDIVDKANSEDQWRWWFKNAQDVLGNYPVLNAVGNHDQSAFYPATAFQEHFTNPNTCTDPSVTPGTVYSFDYGAAHFVVLNSENKGAGFTAQHDWADKDMANTKQPFIIVALHRPMYDGSAAPSDTFTAFGDILDKYNVPLVLDGHVETYIRTKPMRNGQIAVNGNGTIHLSSGGGGNKQGSAPAMQNYIDAVATPGAPTASIITITNSQISVHTVTVQNTSPFATAPVSVQPLQASVVSNSINPPDSTIDFTIDLSLKKLVTNFTSSGSIDNTGIANSLLSKLANNNLNSFVNEVQAQSGKHISSEAATYLLRVAEYVMQQK